MRLALLIPVLLFTAGLAAGRTETYGKTDAQILAMGRDRWFEFYTGRAGESTASMCSAEELYGGVLLRRNDRLLARAPRERRARLLRLRKLLRDFGSEMTEASACFSGGGTVWNPVRSALRGDVEEVIGPLAGVRSKPAPARLVGQVTRRLDDAEQKGDAAREEMATYSPPYTYANFRSHLSRARTAYTHVVANAAKLSRRDSDRVLDYCYRKAALH